MAQALIRNVDDDLLEDYRDAAKSNRRSLEAELRDGLKRARPAQARHRRALVEEVRAMLPDTIPGPDGTDIIRWFRDTSGGRWPDVFGY